MNTLILLLLTGGAAWAQRLVSPSSRSCYELGVMSEGPQADRRLPEYVAGEEMVAKVHVPQVETGVFEFYLCPKTGPGDEDCLMRWPLEISGVEGRQFKVKQVKQGGEYQIPVIIPEDFTCEICTLQWTLLTEQCAPGGGVDEDDETSCSIHRTTMCSDISIVEQKQRQKRSWDFIADFFVGALHGAIHKYEDARGRSWPRHDQ